MLILLCRAARGRRWARPSVWMSARAGQPCPQGQGAMVPQGPGDLGQVQANEVKLGAKRVLEGRSGPLTPLMGAG